jgi:cyclophilin family peptidyl-prolyl cis-trans isomerase
MITNRRGSAEKSVRNSFRAAEKGKTNLLPTSSSNNGMLRPSLSTNGAMNRARSSSTNSFTSRRNNTTPHEELQQMTHSLRSRKRASGGSTWGAISDDEGGVLAHSSPQQDHLKYQQRSVKPSWSDTFGKTEKPLKKRDLVLCLARSTLTIKRAHVFQALITCLVTVFVWDSYQKALATTEQLLIVKHEESMMMLHLKRLEEQSLSLHESIARLSDASIDLRLQDHDENLAQSEPFDGEIIKIQTKQLQDMGDELSHEVKALQAKIQHSDREHIVRTFGEGPVQVALDLAFPQQQQQDSSRISVLLWYDTPHAARTLIEQINDGLWNDSIFRLDKNVAITLEPPRSDTLKKLDFVEKGQKTHASWTVGLSETSQGGLSLFINLQDNSLYHKHDVCIGKVIDGFDTLQRLTRVARNSMVTVKRAAASHLPRRQSADLLA